MGISSKRFEFKALLAKQKQGEANSVLLFVEASRRWALDMKPNDAERCRILPIASLEAKESYPPQAAVFASVFARPPFSLHVIVTPCCVTYLTVVIVIL